jgi:hypothetical protein
MDVIDGVYVRRGGGQGDEDDALSFEAAPPPSRDELVAMVEHIYARTMKWLHRHHVIRDPDESNAPAEMSPTEALTALGMQRGTLVTMRDGASNAGDATSAQAAPPRPSDGVVHERFNLHASAPLRADDDAGRDRLCRYLTRPAFALERIRLLRDGFVAYRVKRVSRNRVTERVMTPVDFLARLGSLVAPPRYPLLRLHGVLAARHRWRSRIVRKPRSLENDRSRRPRLSLPTNDRRARRNIEGSREPRELPVLRTWPGRSLRRLPGGVVAAEGRVHRLVDPILEAERLGPNIVAAAHWHRLVDGELYASCSRPEWARLLKRTFEKDVRECVRCGGRLTLHALVTDPETVSKILSALARARASGNAA